MNIQKRRALMILAFAFAALSACSGTQKAIDTKVAQETAVKNNADLRSEADRMIENDAALNADQKQRLTALRTSISAQTSDIAKQELRLRSVLVEELLSPNYSIDEVALIKKRLKKLEKQRLSLLFNGVDQANAILGHLAHTRSPMMRAMMEDRSNDGRN
ncbi:MAG: hypothetical protein ACXVB9_20535 [Bdellovibrionota bacterium]